MLAAKRRAKQTRQEPLKTMREEWLKESWKRLREDASYGMDAVSAQVERSKQQSRKVSSVCS